tara:strand:+ start:1189 stop:1569 length:381 start_codon:yes stop_codon:yes gene_type:complete
MSEQSNYPKSNIGSEYFNLNICRTFIQPLATAKRALSGASRDIDPAGDGWPCSEVIIKNLTGVVVYIWDKDYQNADGNNFFWQMEDNDEMTFRGITNMNQVSAASASGTPHDLFIRAQYYSSNPSR